MAESMIPAFPALVALAERTAQEGHDMRVDAAVGGMWGIIKCRDCDEEGIHAR